MAEQTETMVPIDVNCPHCQDGQLCMTGVIAAFNAPAPDLFAIDCDKCGCQGSGYQRSESEGWNFTWDGNTESQGGA